MGGGTSVGIGVASTTVGVVCSVGVDVGGRGVEVAGGSGVSVGADVPGAQAARRRASKMTSSCPVFIVSLMVKELLSAWLKG